MSTAIFEEVLLFIGLMATLGSITKIATTLIRTRRGAAAIPAATTDALAEIARRLERLEHAVDSTAVEVERISEGQRFTTKLLSESRGGLPASRAIEKAITPH